MAAAYHVLEDVEGLTDPGVGTQVTVGGFALPTTYRSRTPLHLPFKRSEVTFVAPLGLERAPLAVVVRGAIHTTAGSFLLKRGVSNASQGVIPWMELYYYACVCKRLTDFVFLAPFFFWLGTQHRLAVSTLDPCVLGLYLIEMRYVGTF